MEGATTIIAHDLRDEGLARCVAVARLILGADLGHGGLPQRPPARGVGQAARARCIRVDPVANAQDVLHATGHECGLQRRQHPRRRRTPRPVHTGRGSGQSMANDKWVLQQ